MLRRYGDWLDWHRASLVEEALDREEGLLPAIGRAFGRVSYGDAIGALAVFVLLILGVFVAFGAGLPTGGDELMGVVR